MDYERSGQSLERDKTAKKLSFIAHEQSKKLRRHIQRVKMQDFTFQTIMGLPISVAGSRGDGSNDYKSDTDLIFVVKNILVVEKANVLQRYHTNGQLDVLHYETNTCHPGYCNLKYTQESLCGSNNSLLFRSYANDDGYLSSEKFLQYAMQQVPEFFRFLGGHLQNAHNIHGPCVTPKHLFGKDQNPAEIDFAFSIECDSWPTVAKEWLERERVHNWPDKSLVQKVLSTRCSFVPIGFSLDESQRCLEWRISFTMAEKHLTWSFSGTQLLCLDGLKLLHSAYIEPRHPKLLCSYFLKTLMFWLVEGTSRDFWREENFFVCFKTCLDKLLESMETATCPHFFIPENNMFDKKDKVTLKIAASFMKSLDLDVLLLSYIEMKDNFYRRNVVFQNHIHIANLTLSRHLVYGQLTSVARENITETLAHYSQLYTNLQEVDTAITKQLGFSLTSTLGSAILSEIGTTNITDKGSKLQEAIRLLREGTRSDALAGNLKFATALMFLGKTDEARSVISQVETVDIKTLVHYSFYSRLFIKEPDDESHPIGDKMPLPEVMKRFVALDVIFLPSEMRSVPDFVKFQLLDGLPLFMSPIVYRYCLEFECHKLKSDKTSMRNTYEKYCETRKLFPSGGVPHIDIDLKAYFDMSLGENTHAFQFLKLSILSGKSGSACLWMLSLLLHKQLKRIN